ncbi:hypothetical protein C0J26_03350 [Pseudomonas baetica]|nr:hypothetical protein C0J26_03350 [Pseudomonas baetica]
MAQRLVVRMKIATQLSPTIPAIALVVRVVETVLVMGTVMGVERVVAPMMALRPPESLILILGKVSESLA